MKISLKYINSFSILLTFVFLSGTSPFAMAGSVHVCEHQDIASLLWGSAPPFMVRRGPNRIWHDMGTGNGMIMNLVLSTLLLTRQVIAQALSDDGFYLILSDKLRYPQASEIENLKKIRGEFNLLRGIRVVEKVDYMTDSAEFHAVPRADFLTFFHVPPGISPEGIIAAIRQFASENALILIHLGAHDESFNFWKTQLQTHFPTADFLYPTSIDFQGLYPETAIIKLNGMDVSLWEKNFRRSKDFSNDIK